MQKSEGIKKDFDLQPYSFTNIPYYYSSQFQGMSTNKYAAFYVRQYSPEEDRIYYRPSLLPLGIILTEHGSFNQPKWEKGL